MSAVDLTLTPNQKASLRAALASNQPQGTSPRTTKVLQNLHSPSTSMSEYTAPGSGHLDLSDDSPFLDFGLDGELDESFNFDAQGQLIGDLPEAPGARDLHDKRKSLDDSNDEDEEGGGKRREGDDKTAKKPGRKPLTSEPTTKRKAQNRAAQRAFRERKERHLKDLETKVEELEKTSESANHENGLLRAQVERLQIELKEYRKRLSWIANGGSRLQQGSPQHNRNSLGGGNDFQFEFPKFGDLPAVNFKSSDSALAPQRTSSVASARGNASASPASATAPNQHSVNSRNGSIGNSPMNTNSPVNNYTASPSAQSYQGKNSVDSLSGLFSPSILEATRNNSLSYFPEARSSRQTSVGRSSFDTFGSVPGLVSTSSTNTDSPGSTADSHHHTSSMGTSPEPIFNSPTNKQDFNLGSVSEDKPLNTFGKSDLCAQISKACGDCNDPIPPMLSKSNMIALDSQNFANDFNPTGIDWLAQQNGGGFDPVLFGDYRETQDNVLSQDFGSFFNDAYPLPDLGSPMHNYGDLAAPVPDNVAKNDLMRQVDAATNGEEVVPADKTKMLTCNKIWDRLQSMEKFRNGEIDIDNLCSELRAKAKCSEGGAVVDEKHVNKLLGL